MKRNIKLTILTGTILTGTLICLHYQNTTLLYTPNSFTTPTNRQDINTIITDDQDTISVQLSSLQDFYSKTYIKDHPMKEDLIKSKSINNDTVAYLKCDELKINYPIVYSPDDNKEYLRKNIHGEYDIEGTPYLDYQCSLSNSPFKLIHGHNMANGSQFANIPTLLDLDNLTDAPLLEYYDDNGYRMYRIIAIYTINSKETAFNINPFLNSDDMNEFLDISIKQSQVTPPNIERNLDILVLNTCWYGNTGHERNLRCIVIAIRDIKGDSTNDT